MSSFIPKDLKLKVMEKINFKCAYCGKQLPDNYHGVEHVIPVSRGGTNDIENLLPTCVVCNSMKYVNNIPRFRYLLSCRLAGLLPIPPKLYANYKEHGYELPMPPLIDFYIEKITGKKLGE